MIEKSPTFQYWNTILNIEITGLIMIRAHRDQNFPLYVESLKELTPWFFALDHQNYARWLPVHINDMERLPPAVLKQFVENGFWVVTKTCNKFSAIPIDQAHEQNNKIVKGSGGAVGLTENPTAFRKWMVAGPEQARIIQEFEDTYMTADANDEHHNEGQSAQKTFRNQVSSLVDVIREMGNPFKDDFAELVTLDTRNCMEEAVVSTVRNIESLGKTKYHEYMNDVVEQRTRSIHDPIKRNSLPLFKHTSTKKKSKKAEQASLLKSDVALFSQMYIAMQNRQGDMSEFFSHENHPFPPALADCGNMRSTKKSDLLTCMDNADHSEVPVQFDMVALDGAAVVHLLSTAGSTTFAEYAEGVFLPYIFQQLERCSRVDIVWDIYRHDSLKEATRDKRGKGIRRKVANQTKLPGNWNDFLRDPTNKTELFNFLSMVVSKAPCPPGKEIFITSGRYS